MSEELPVKTYPPSFLDDLQEEIDSDRVAAMCANPEGMWRLTACVNACEGLSDDALEGGWTAQKMKEYNRQLESLIERFCAAIVDDPLGIGIEHTRLLLLKREALEVKKKALIKPARSRETTVRILRQGDVKMAHCLGYMLSGNENAVCFFIDPSNRAYISASTESDSGCPVVYVSEEGCEQDTEIEFSEFPGWRFHAGGEGKTIAIALVRRGAVDA